MENLLPELSFQSNVRRSTLWSAPDTTPSQDDDRYEEFQPNPFKDKRIVLHSSKSPNHPSRKENLVGWYSKETNPSPLSLATTGHNNASSRGDMTTLPPIGKKSRLRMSRNRSNQGNESVNTSHNSVKVFFSNQMTREDFQVYYTKLGGRTIMDFVVQPMMEISKTVLGAAKTSKNEGVQIDCFPFQPERMLDSAFVFPVAATRTASCNSVTMIFSANHTKEMYDLFSIDQHGHLALLASLGDENYVKNTFADHPFVVWCRNSNRGICINMQQSAASSKVRYSLVVDDNIPSVSFMAHPNVDTQTSVLNLSFYPR